MPHFIIDCSENSFARGDKQQLMQIVFDAGDPRHLAEFWATALGYVTQPPPDGFSSWERFGTRKPRWAN